MGGLTVQAADGVVTVVNDPMRQCFLSNGHPKTAYRTFDDAFDQIACAVGRNANRTHIYRCPFGHGWHIARTRLSGASNGNGKAVY